MLDAPRTRGLVEAMAGAAGAPVSIKCRLGVIAAPLDDGSVPRDATTYDYGRVLATISSVDEDHHSLLDAANSTECPITCDYCSYSYLYEDCDDDSLC